MFSLDDLLGQQQGSQAVNQISQNVGADQSMVSSAIQLALPMLINSLANNASTPAGAESLNNALERDHDGSVLDNIGGLTNMIFGGGQQAAAPAPSGQVDAGGILGHILGGGQGQVAQEVSNRTGLNIGQVAQILMFLAPIVMGYLGKQKQDQGLGADGISNWLGGQQEQIQQAPQGSIINSILDSDHDGSAVDDIASMAYKYMTGK